MAIAPERMGIGIQRRFTTPGQHPYDTVVWERRDARIANFATGAVAFEQLGVEVPSTWSLNATNILAQKYFRGTLGTPEREWSLKQVVDRVVDTITAWGRKDGYFVDDAEADTFSDELKYLIIHQKIAFNSPVWFNIGVSGVPQQGSACQPYDSLVCTPDGLIPIGKLVETNAVGDKVYDAHGLTRIVAVKSNGRKQVLRIHTKAGVTLDVTPDHFVWKASGSDSGRFVEASALRPGDRLTWHRRESWGGGEIFESELYEAALAGWIQSHGFVGQFEGTNPSLTLEAMTVNADELDWVSRAIDRVFPAVHRHERTVTTKDQSLDCRRTRLYGKGLNDFVSKWDLRSRGCDMEVPSHLFAAPLPVVRCYLRSIFQAEGYVSLKDTSALIGCDMISEKLIRGAQQLLARFGIFSRVRFKADRRSDRKGCWSLTIRNAADRRRFADEIGFIDSRKSQRLEESFALPGRGYNDLKLLEIERIETVGEAGVYDIQTESGEYLSGNLRVHNCFILAVKDSMDSILNWYTEEGIIFKGGSGAGVNLSKIRSSREGLRGGGTASGPVSFMRGADASAGTIKSGGKCFREGTLVATPGGLQPIEQLRVGDLVLTHAGPQKVADFMPNGVKQCYKVVTREGYEVEVTAGHKFAYWNADSGAFEVKPIEEFQPGDALYTLVEQSLGGVKIPLLPPQLVDPAHATTTVDMRFPTELDDRLAYVLGLSYGDGELRTVYPYRVRVAFCKDAPGRLSAERFTSYCEELFGDRPLNLGEYEGHFQLGFTRKRLVDFLVVNGIAKGKGNALGFPAGLFRAEPEVRAAFIAGVIDADGTYQRRGGWSITSIDRDFLVQLQRLVLTLGVPSKLRVSREARGTWQTLYRLQIVGHTFIDRLVQHIRPYSAKASTNYVPSDGADKGWGYRPSLYRSLDNRVERRGGHKMIDRAVGSNNETTGYGAVATLTRHPHDSVASYSAQLSTCVQVTLHSVTPTESAPTYDIEVEGAHLLSANGIYASNTRRAAKMVILNADHPDIEDFIWCKAIEERKARALRDAGFDMDLDGKDSYSIQYQNANNSVRVTDEFMHAVVDDADWHLRGISDGEILETMKARDLFRQIAKAAWECADPGMQFDTTINRWHTAPNTDRINASNPCCFVGETRVVTDSGSVPIADLARLCDLGDALPRVRTLDESVKSYVDSPVVKAWVAGYTQEVVAVRTSSGGELRCTPDHRFLTAGGAWVEARLLAPGTQLQSMHGSDSVAAVDFVHLPTEVAVYDIEVAGTHNFGVETGDHTAVVVHNSEYMHLDNSACNLASLNLLTFLEEDGAFDVDGFKAATEVVFTGQEIIVGNADYPTEKIAENSRRFRQLGIGYANLGALLMAQGLPYDSDTGRAWAGAITALLTGHSYATSARTAARMGPFAGYQDNREPMLTVLRMHRDAAAHIDEELVPPELLSAAQEAWDTAVDIAEQYGVRNSQASVLAPTGTIGLLMDCDTTGIEPDLGLVKMKKLVGGGTMSIVNQTVPRALEQLGYNSEQIAEIISYIDEHKSILGAPHLQAEHLPVFACSMGDNTIHYSGHIRMMGAVQPFISGAISKTVNVPEEVTVEDIEQLHIEAWELGLKAIAIYRDNCKVAQPLATAKKTVADPSASPAEVHDAELALKVAELESALQNQTTVVVKQPIRERLPRKRTSSTFAFRVADCEGYVTVGEYEDGRPGEVFIKVSKQGSTLSGIMDAFSIAISLGLQHGVPLATFVKKYTNMRFEPAGMTDDPDLRIAQSLMDYIFRRLAVDYLAFDERAELGVLTTKERTQQTLPGIDETTTPNLGLDAGPQVSAAVPTNQPEPPPAVEAMARPVAESDAPYCFQCGVQMQRAGSCHACPSCGTTSGCS